MNSVNLTGRVGVEPEARFTSDGKTIVNLPVYVRKDKEKSYRFTCVCYDKTADMVMTYVHKGDLVGISGSLTQREYTNSQSQKVEVVEVYVSRVDLLQSKTPAQPQEQPQGQPQFAPPPARYQQATTDARRGNYPPQYDNHTDDDIPPLLDIASDDLPF